MGLLRDIYDIINKEPVAKAAIQDQLLQVMKGGWRAPKLTIRDQIENQKQLISSITEAGFSTTFSELIDYFGVLLATAVGTTYLKHRGCIIRNFYCSEHHLYFPAPGEEPKVYRGKIKKTNETIRALTVGGTDNFYSFYAFQSKDNNINLDKMRVELSNIVRKSEASEAETFLTYLKDNGFSVLELQGIVQKAEEQRFWFFPRSAWETTQINLSFENPEDIKKWLAEDLQETLDFQLI